MVLNIILCAVIALQSILHYIERGRLQDRIMSRNLNEFKARDKEHTPHITAHDRVMRNWKSRE